MTARLAAGALLVAVAVVFLYGAPQPEARSCRISSHVVRVHQGRWPHIYRHARFAIVHRHKPAILHIDRADATRHREQSLRGIPTRHGYDRDEYPPAVSREGGRGADVRYVRSRENRSAGESLGAQLRRYCNRQRFKYMR